MEATALLGSLGGIAELFKATFGDEQSANVGGPRRRVPGQVPPTGTPPA
jgi:hypothetical protein